MIDRRIGKTYNIIDTSLPPNSLGQWKLVSKLGPGHFTALMETGEVVEVYSCQLQGEVVD